MTASRVMFPGRGVMVVKTVVLEIIVCLMEWWGKDRVENDIEESRRVQQKLCRKGCQKLRREHKQER
jgi:hypothetical protein